MATIRIKSDKELASLGLRVDPDDPTRLIPVEARQHEAGSPGRAAPGTAAGREGGREAVEGGDPRRPAPPSDPTGGTPDPSGPIQVDPRIEAVLPPPSPSEAAFLERRLLADRGRQVELAVWSDGWRLLDDFHTYRLCVQHGIAYNVRLVGLPNVEAAIRWRLEANLGQQNLSPLQSAWARGRLYLSLRRRPGRPRKAEEGEPFTAGSTDDELAARWHVDARTVRRDAAFARAILVIEDRLGVAFRDKILTREYPMTRGQVIAWAKDLRSRTVDEAEVQARAEKILEERRERAERRKGRGGNKTGSHNDGHNREGTDMPKDRGETGSERADLADSQVETPLLRLYRAWDDADDEERRTFLTVPGVYDLAAEVVGCEVDASSSGESGTGA
jgi:hypothetical protein